MPGRLRRHGREDDRLPRGEERCCRTEHRVSATSTAYLRLAGLHTGKIDSQRILTRQSAEAEPRDTFDRKQSGPVRVGTGKSRSGRLEQAALI